MAEIPTSTQYYYIRKGRSGKNPNDVALTPEGGSQFWSKVENPNYVAPDTRTTTEKLTDEYTQQYGEAKAVNEARYNELLSDVDKQYASAEEYLKGYGTTAKAKIAEQSQQGLSNAIQNLASSGLYNTTAYGGEIARSQKSKQEAEQSLDESINTQKLNTLGNIQAQKRAIIEARTDSYPDLSTYLNLLNQYGYNTGDASGSSSSTSGTGSSGSYGTGGLDGKGNTVGVTMKLPNGKTVTNYGTALPTGATSYKAGGGTARTSSFKNSYGSKRGVKLQTPKAYTTSHSPELVFGGGSGTQFGDTLHTKYGTVTNNKNKKNQSKFPKSYDWTYTMPKEMNDWYIG